MAKCLHWIDPFAVSDKAREDLGWIYTAIARAPFFFIISAFFNTWLIGIAKFQVDGEGKVNWFGVSFNPSSYSAVYFTLYNILAAIICPIAGAMVDYTPVRKEALIGFSYGAAFLLISTAFSLLHWWVGGLIIVFTFVLYDCQVVLSSAYLPEIGGNEAERGKISNKANVYSMLWVFFFIIAFSVLSFPFLFGSPTVSLRNGSFETEFDSNSAKFNYNFTLTTVAGQVVDSGLCGGPSAGICDSVVSPGDALLGGRVLKAQIPADHRLRIFQDVEKADTAKYSGLKLIFYGRVKNMNSNDASVQFTIVNSNKDNTEQVNSERKPLTTGDYEFFSVQGTTIEGTNGILFRLDIIAGSNPVTIVGDDFLASNKPDFLPVLWTVITGIFWVIINIIGLRHLKHRDGLKKRLTAAEFLPVVASNLGRSIVTVSKDRDLICFLISQGLASAASTGLNSLLPVLLVDVAKLDSGSTGILYGIAFVFVILGGALHDYIARRFQNYARTMLFTYVLAIFSIILGFILINSDGLAWLIFVIGAIMGVVIGGFAVLTPVIISSMIPVGKEAEYFGLLTFFWKALSWTAPLAYTLTVEATGKIQNGLFAISAFFIVALLLHALVRPRVREVKKVGGIEVELDERVDGQTTGQKS